ncbi:MAG: phosphotransferase [Proteobacteria bacterium]|nr:phosphotransferase [Pseudomonadota bacterium]
MIKIHRHFPYQMGTELNLDQKAREDLVCAFEKPPMDCEDILAGRAMIFETNLSGVGPVVIKHYKRGGLIRHLISDVYLRSGKARSRQEYEMLETVRSLGVSSPEPLAWAIRGSQFYKAYLITRKIENTRSLTDICTKIPEQSAEALKKTAEQINRLIVNRIHHVDLHPGNVLVDGDGKVFIIDFDKAHISPMSQKKLCKAYIKRWTRAVLKYKLPTIMVDILVQELALLKAS